MKSVVMIAHGFPPEGNAGVYRALRFVRHLPALGWRPIVVTLETDVYERYDPGLLQFVPRDTEVIKVRNIDPWLGIQRFRAKHTRKKVYLSSQTNLTNMYQDRKSPLRSFVRETVRTVEAWCYHPDLAMGWIRPAVRTVAKLSARDTLDVIWATAGPVSSFIVAQRVSHLTGLPYVLDFRDAWTITYNEFEERRPNWARHSDRRAMFRLLKEAQAVIFRYDTEAECYWHAYPEALDVSRIYIIPNGYEGTIERFSIPDETRCNILYTGTLSDYRYDTLLQALHVLKQFYTEEAKQLHFRFVGEGTERLVKETEALGLSDIVSASGPTSHEAVTRLYPAAHALLVLGRPATMRGYDLFAPAKLFGYLKLGRPIVGVLPLDEANKILSRLGVTTVADVNSVPEIVAVFRRLISAWISGQLSSLAPDADSCQRYSAECQSNTLASALEGRASPEPFVPGRVEIPTSLREDIAGRQGESPLKDVFPRQENPRHAACVNNNR